MKQDWTARNQVLTEKLKVTELKKKAMRNTRETNLEFPMVCKINFVQH